MKSTVIDSKMRWSASAILLLAWLASSAAEDSVSSSDQVSTSVCDKDWVYSNGFCYYFSDPLDVVNPIDAPHKCLLSDAEHVYPESPEELRFLQSQSKGRNAYGWYLNVEKYNNDLYTHSHVHLASTEPYVYFTPLPDTIPTVQEAYDKDNKCVALHVQNAFLGSKSPKISTEPCDVWLRIVCQGKKSEHPSRKIDSVHNFGYGDFVFWLGLGISNKTVATNYCKSVGMEVAYNVEELLAAVNGSYDGTPWWLGITIDQNGPKLDNGAKADLKNLAWLSSDFFISANLVLLHSGKARYIDDASFDNSKDLPYICKKRASVKSVFGCPDLWIRGGRSCYSISKEESSLTWHKAKETCEKRGSHLLTINSLDEKLWIEEIALNHVSRSWTSANDLTTEGKFTWHDGSDVDNKMLPWLKAPFDGFWNFYETKCVALDISQNDLVPRVCDLNAFPACQYELRDGETECDETWKKLDGTCYQVFSGGSYASLSYNRVNQFCKQYVDRSHGPVVVKTRKVAELLSTFTIPYSWHPYVWLGMQLGDTMDSWTWQDGSGDKVDFSVFNIRDEPDNGGGEKPENCVAINGMNHAYDSQCDEDMPYICEKDLAPVTALGPKPDSVAALRVMAFVPIVSALAGTLSIRWL